MASRWRALTLATLLFSAIGVAPIAAAATWRQELRCHERVQRYHPKYWKRAYHPHDRWRCDHGRYDRQHDDGQYEGRHRSCGRDAHGDHDRWDDDD